MKTKFLTVLAMLTCATLVSAQTFNRIYVNISQGTASDQLRLLEAPSFTADFDNNYDVVKMMVNSDVYVYAMAPDQNSALVAHSKVYTNNLQGLVLGYRATNAGTATITFSNLQSDLADVTDYYLYDTEKNVCTQISTTTSYNFAVAANSSDDDRFVILKSAYVTLNGYGLATFSADYAVAIPAGLQAWKAQYQSLDQYLLLDEVNGTIPANTGVILSGTASADYTMIPAASVAALSENDLKPASAWTTNPGNVFVLNGNLMYEYTGSEMKANKAYLDLGSAPAPKRIRLVFDAETAIDNVEVEAVKAEKFVENGQIFIRRGNEVFNLQGQIVK